jgi:N-terminal domain of M60-like peptidases/Peptidase M60, enhancin and enhancin-like
MTFDIQIANRLSIVKLASLAIVCSLLISCGGGGSTSNPDSNAAPSADPTIPAPGTATTSPTAGTSTPGTTPTGTTPSTATPTVPTPVPTPDAACPAAAVSWNVGGNTCVANAAASVSGAMAAVNDATGLATGSAAFLCTNGKLAATPATTATCKTPTYDDSKFGLIGFAPCTNAGSTTPLQENDTLKLGGIKTDVAFGNGRKTHRFVYLFNQTADLVLKREAFTRDTLDSYAFGGVRLAYCKKSPVDGDNTTVFLAALTKLTNHLNGTRSLSPFDIREQHTLMATTMAELAGSETTLNEAFKLIDLYDKKRGPLFTENSQTKDGFENVPVRDSATSDANIDNYSIDRAVFALVQAIFEDVYAKPVVYKKYENFLKGKKFLTSHAFPGKVKNGATPANGSVKINASVPRLAGVAPRYSNENARRPTGYFLAPGDVGSVTVPANLAGKGIKILVGAHTSDKSAVDHVYRPYRMHMEFLIETATTKIYNPFGGSIYIIVPITSSFGVVDVNFQNVVASPFFSNTSHRKTTLVDWEIQRKNPGPMADFETDKFMLQVPTSFIFNYKNPDVLMAEWDKRMDAIHSVHGQPLINGNVKMFKQIDAYPEHDGFAAPGYPISTDYYRHTYDSGRAGNEDVWYLRTGPNSMYYGGDPNNAIEQFAFIDFHELGHSLQVSMWSEYTEYESLNNLLAVAVYNIASGQNIDIAFANSLGSKLNRQRATRDLAAIDWMVTYKFRDGLRMNADEMSYQYRGYAKYVDIAVLFTWDTLGKFFKEEHERAIVLGVNRRPTFDDGFSKYYYGAVNGEGIDSRILRMSKAAGADLRPLFHFWGVQPVENTKLAAALKSLGLLPSQKIYDRLAYYKTVIPNGTTAYYDWQDKLAFWNDGLAQQTRDSVDKILSTTGNNYFPNGRP